ncbi:MAG: fructosamine kinase family protein [Gammaproteobacteria bacterium]|nr:fructosamine kinase family protein [Gammaproteobacteria bacterium]
MPKWPEIAARLKEAGGPQLDPQTAQPVGGGCIHSAWRVESPDGDCFIKVHDAGALRLFEAEACGLEMLAAAQAVRVPEVIAYAATASEAFLALEWIELGARSAGTDGQLGSELARQHRVTHAAFGLDRDNAIGSTLQLNGWHHDWVAFFRDRRLGFQLRLATENGFGSRLAQPGERLLDRLESFFAGAQPRPSLLHGDLWSGNAAADRYGRPVIFDPAVYFGDREADVAMTRLFGGFSSAFYSAYAEAWPLPEAHEARVDLYNLYHVLNHLNLFGAGYLGQARSLLERLL